MRIACLILSLCLVHTICSDGQSQQPAFTPKLLLAVASYRDRPRYPTITFYEHDGQALGRIVGTVPTVNMRSDSRPSLTHDGKLCAFASELENQTSKIFVWHLADKKLLELPKLNDSPNALLHPCLAGDGTLLTMAAWSRPGGNQRWDVAGYDLAKKAFVELAGVNSQPHDERMPCLCGKGRFLAYTSNGPAGASGTDVRLFDLVARKPLPLMDMNSPSLDISPSLSADGRLIAFASDRPGGAGGRDVYLYDRGEKRFVPLPGLNSAAHEQTPSLSPDGRYITFVSERIAGVGERDVFLYDCQTNKLLPTPGLNSEREDIDPCVINWSGVP